MRNNRMIHSNPQRKSWSRRQCNQRIAGGQFLRQMLLRAALGIVLMEIAGAVTYVIDGTITSGFLGPKALAANGMAGICFTIFAVISGIFSAGVSGICSEEIGKGNTKKCSSVFSMAFFLTTLLSIMIAFVGVLFCDQIALMIGANKETGEIYEHARMYIKGFFIGAPGHILFALLIPEVQLCGKNKRIITSIIVLMVVDAVGDILNVKVFHGGMFGMGLATSISYFASLFVLLTVFYKNKLFAIRFRRMDFSELGSVLKIGLPRATKRIGNILRPLILNRLIIVTGGAAAMAAFSVEQNIRYVMESLGVGIGGAVFLLGGIFLGEKDDRRLRTSCRFSIRYILVGVTGLAVLYYISAPWIAGAYISVEDGAYPWTVDILRCHAVSLPFLALNEFYQNLFQAQKRYTLTHIHTFCNKFICVVLLSFLLRPRYGVLGLWLAIPFSEIVLLVVVILYQGIKNCIEKNPYGFFSVVKPTSIGEKQSLEIQISSMNDYAKRIDSIIEFCKENHLTEKQLYYIELFIEEIGAIIQSKGFSEGTRQMIEIRVYIDQEELIIRTKDNGRPISALEQLEYLEKIKDGEYLGMQMLHQLSSQMQYITSMNINNFVIKIAKEEHND